ncbi:hypothetical protein Phum_PHUM247140 [Pediculus humanus corporis]|uniref:C2H2-type domain-containing protein n=1 Tax=Pediculus humanus subsp. corporis TaxID=121224 RepID=E0VJK4_PEDHC|nr:uncharacterized protein Phum_PHUM247140 [Pediculus humanus corporis]EEB13560.1 hypothetical protein Phum_PHUM247140 [Pediculus humanus corporis]
MFNLENYYDFYETCIRAQTLLQSKLGDGGDATAVCAPIIKEDTGGIGGVIPNLERLVHCDLCSASFTTAKDRWTHVLRTHKGDPRITCTFCRKSFSTISALNFHKKNKHPEEMDELEKKLKPLPKLQKINEIPKIQNKTYETVRNFLNNKTENILQDARHSDLANFNVKIGNTDIKFGNASITVGNTDIRVGNSGGVSENRASENQSMIDRLKNLGVDVFTGNSKTNDYNSESLYGHENVEHHRRKVQKKQKIYSSSDEQNATEFQNPEDLLELDMDLEGNDNVENIVESESIFGCEVCFRDFKDRSSLWLHMLYSHKVEAGCTCGICLKLFSNYHELALHGNLCKDQIESEKRRYYCKICYRQHDSKKKLESHTSIHNLNDDFIKENFDLNNLISSNPTMTEKIKLEDYMEADVSEYSDTYSQELDITNDSTQHSMTGNGYPNAGQQYFDEVQSYRDQLAYQNFLEGSGHFLESSSFFDNIKTEETKTDANQSEDLNKFRCDECYRSYETSLQLTKHKYNVHRNPNRLQYRNDSFGNPVYECEYCGQTYDSPKQLTKHRYNVHKFPTNAVPIDETGKQMFNCSECPRAFETPRQLQKHRYNVHKAMRKPAGQSIPGCDSPSSVESFKPGFHYSSFDCEICGEKSTSKTERWKHCYKQHQNEEKLVCSNEDCKKIMPTENFQKEHMNFHAMQGKYPICCEICSKLWTTKMEFWKHVSGVHYSLIGLTCGVCMRMFLTLDELKAHIKIHEPLSEAEFNCDICGRGYSSKPKMTRHRLIHENDPESDEYNILKHTLLKGNKPPPPPVEKGKYEILNIPKINRNYENDLEIIEVNPDDNGLVDLEHEENTDTLWCDVCPDLTFADLDELRSHRRNIHALYPCDLCPKFYGGVSHLWKHTNRSHKNHPDITCEYCGKTSASRIQLRGHINKNHKEILLGHVVSEGGNPLHVLPDPDPTNLNCRRCGREFRIRSLVRRHERTCLTKTNFDPDPTNLNCQKCGKYYPIRSLVRRHEKACLNRIIKDVDPANLNCKVCGKEFPKRSYCRRHERTCGTKKERTPKEEGPIEIHCEWCPKQFNNRRAYASHVDYMHSLVTCEICEEDEKASFRSKTELYNHCKEKHSDHPDLLCTFEKCRRLLRTKIDLEKHMRDHKNRDNPPTCEYCADIFKGRKKLRIHMLHQHRSEESRRYICGVCVKVHDDTEKLIAHAYEAHSKIMERDFVCKICAKQYNCNAKVLDHHKNTHDSQYKPCKVCLRIFTDQTLLEEHLQQHAIGDRSVNSDLVTDHQCTICMESFDTVVLLHEHVKENHPNLRENSCLICGKKYQSIYTCYDHMENKHGGTYLTCRKCLMLFTDKEEKAAHMMTHGIQEEVDVLTCTLCRTRNESEEALENHIKESHSELFDELADRNMCLICSKVLKYKYSIFCHVEKNHPQNYCCRVCLMIYKEKDKLDDHVMRLHTRDKAGNPPVFVPKTASSKKPLSTKRPKHMCAVCQKIEENTDELRKHVETEHEFVLSKDMTCFLCGSTYANRVKVVSHVKLYHGPPYMCCRECLKIFDNEDEFVAHVAEHENDVTLKSSEEISKSVKRKRSSTLTDPSPKRSKVEVKEEMEELESDMDKMASEKDNEDSYVCETVKNLSGEEEFKIKIKHSIGTKDATDESKSGKVLKRLENREVVRNGEESSELEGSDKKMGSSVKDMKNFTSCVAE